MLGHFALSQDLPLKCWDISHCPKTTCSSVGTPRTVSRHLTQALGHFALPKNPHSSVATLRTVPRLSFKCWDTSRCPKTLRPSVGTLHTVPRPSVGTPHTVSRPYTLVLGHFALSQDPSSKCWDTSYCSRTSRTSVATLRTVPRLSFKCWDTSRCPKTLRPSVGTLHTVP